MVDFNKLNENRQNKEENKMTDKKKMYGLQTLGRVRVFRKYKVIEGQKKKKYEISDVWYNVSEKEEDGTYFNKSQNLLFKKGLDLPENNTTIELSAFPVITGNGKWRKIALMVTDWSLSEDEK